MKRLKLSDFSSPENIIDLEPGGVIRSLRELHGWTQQELAEKVHMTQNHISRIETGASPLGRDRALVFAQVFGIHPGIILFPNYRDEFKKAG